MSSVEHGARSEAFDYDLMTPPARPDSPNCRPQHDPQDQVVVSVDLKSASAWR